MFNKRVPPHFQKTAARYYKANWIDFFSIGLLYKYNVRDCARGDNYGNAAIYFKWVTRNVCHHS